MRGRVTAALLILLGAADMRLSMAASLDEPIKPIAAAAQQNPARVEIGRRLFQDARLSANGKTSCASCHDLEAGGADRRDRSIGFDGQLTEVNAPTVYNASLNFKQFWNGRADSLEGQVDAVVQNPREMGSKWPDVVAWLSKDLKYRQAFNAAYPDGVTKANVQNAIASFERTLITPSRFDKYLLGDAQAITAEEQRGYEKFKQYGCVACHQGVNVGGNMFQKFGVMGDYFADRNGGADDADLGRYLVTNQEQDKHIFKVPGLRNVALTAPYFHDASAKTIEDAVDVMVRFQLGRTISLADKQAIVKFLNTLTGAAGTKP